MNKKPQPLFKKLQKPKIWQCFRNVVASIFPQKCVSDQRKELHFCHPIFYQGVKTKI